MEKLSKQFRNRKIISIIYLFAISLFTIWFYQSIPLRKLTFSDYLSHSMNFVKYQSQPPSQNFDNRLSFARRIQCNHKQTDMCYSTNKSLVVTFWGRRSKDTWISTNILSAYPLPSFDHIVFVYDNSSWHTHPAYKHCIWIHVDGQLRFWFLKRFISPTMIKSYAFLWIIDDDAKPDFSPLHYQCVIQNLSVPLSSPARLSGPLSHGITRTYWDFNNRIGRWVDFVETGPIVVIASAAWQCIYRYIDASAGSGWGLDMIWCNIIAKKCLLSSESKKACAILDAFRVHHQSTSLYSNDDGQPEISIYIEAYKSLLTKRQNIGPLAPDRKLFEFCEKSS